MHPRYLVIISLLVFMGGCRNRENPFPTVTLRGSVTVDGKPISDGTITFLSEVGGQASSGSIRRGRYEADMVPVGRVRVMFNAIRETGKIVEEGGHSFPERVSIIPLRHSAGQSITIDHQTKVLDFGL